MIKKFCDKCKKEVEGHILYNISIITTNYPNIPDGSCKPKEVLQWCFDCCKEYGLTSVVTPIVEEIKPIEDLIREFIEEAIDER